MTSGGAIRSDDIAAAAQLACLLEVSAPKPGNISPGRHFGDTRYEHFLASAAAIGTAIAEAGQSRVGSIVRRAVETTRRWSTSNTNLGIVLLFAPIAVAAARSATDASSPNLHATTVLRDAVRGVLDATSVEDAAEVYAAIRLATPGGLGRADAQDVSETPTMTLRDVMRLAAERDGIAREYASAFATTFEIGVPSLMRARHDNLAWDDAVVETFLTLLAAAPDTHIARRGGAEAAADVSRLAVEVIGAGGVRSARGRDALQRMDAALRDPRNVRNPGTTADLTAAAIFVAILCGAWHSSTVEAAGRDSRRRS